MLSYFPVPYDDELLYSLIARYSVHTGQSDNQKAVTRDVFGTQTAVAIPDMPSRLSQFRQRVHRVWKVCEAELIERYTLAPLYIPFLNPEKGKLVLASMLSEQGGNIHTRCGIPASNIKQQQYFRYCPVCIEEQYASLGEPYWQRLHQVSSIDVCYKHHCRLIKTVFDLHPKEKHMYFPASLVVNKRQAESLQLKPIDKKIIQSYKELLNLHCSLFLTYHQWTMFYQKVAKENGFKLGKHVDHKSVRNHLMRDYIGSSFFVYLSANQDNDWLVNIFRKHRKSFHSIRHLMIWASLMPYLSVEEILQKVNSFPKDAPKPSKHLKVADTPLSTEVLEKRKNWLKMLDDHLDVGIKAIRTRFGGESVYIWLYRHDNQWLMEHRPEKIKRKNKKKIDYNNWDIENLGVLESVYQNVVNQKNRPRLSRKFFIKRLPRANSVEKHLINLKETTKWLDDYSESIESYQILRIKNAAKTLKEQNLPLKYWRLLRLAGIKKEVITPLIVETIKKLESEDY